jgi:hypothetical protein
MMANGAICPDCGGIIGGDPTGARPACQCSMSLTMDDTAVEAQPAPAATATSAAVAPAAPPPGAKICIKCGKDVTHAKRAKDAKGYWCYECHKADLRRERAEKPRARCPQCGRLVPAESITTYHGITLCAKCRMEQDDLPKHLQLKYKPKLGDDKEKVEKQKKMVKILAIALGVLVIVAVLGSLHLL